MTTVRHEAHRICVIVRLYPTTGFWLLTCAIVAADLEEAHAALWILLGTQFLLIVHMAREMWSPPVLISLSQADHPATLIPIPAQPGPHPSERRHHRHARR